MKRDVLPYIYYYKQIASGESKFVSRLEVLNYEFMSLGKARFSNEEYFLRHGSRLAWNIWKGYRK